ncbi:MAG: hypothetical protein KDD82_13635 [Planctomycetes bacterium]|nr:hypothetical protein [Planctomycetota bacterium]
MSAGACPTLGCDGEALRQQLAESGPARHDCPACAGRLSPEALARLERYHVQLGARTQPCDACGYAVLVRPEPESAAPDPEPDCPRCAQQLSAEAAARLQHYYAQHGMGTQPCSSCGFGVPTRRGGPRSSKLPQGWLIPLALLMLAGLFALIFVR